MSWAGLANNQTVSFNNLQDAVNNSVFVAKITIPSSNEQITKADADTYVYINTSAPAYSAKSSSQLVVKSNLTSSMYTISWSTSDLGSGASQTLEISVNGSLVVSATTNSSGVIYVSAGSYINASMTAGTGATTAEAYLSIVDNGTNIYNNTATGYPLVFLSYGPYYPSGNGSIDGTAYQY